MKKTAMSLLVVTALLGSLLTACSGNANNNSATPPATNTPIASESPTPSPSPSDEPNNTEKPDDNATESSTDKIMKAMLDKVEQPGLMDLTKDDIDTYYVINTDLVDEFTIKTPAFNLSANEIAVIKVKDSKHIDEIKKTMEQRGADVQKMFENYLPEPYKLAQNYKIATVGNYVLFLISESADELEKAFKEAAASA
ncbi:DUF4358 domain-containing protein [Paenibacillus sp. 1011MAR3C5]|uniref:DUF4358 domain-containing protein n=1 Tax=Paenibacillus sp. 1011MAR3C5 TaxID=1675787 RepID=UPI000E6CDC24|nr:DUF4358 domain-containing protein [Paenibacillus sp. 1011MAR3C5]RJE87053.1 DUF4358 domain-containing protein [Paenibacillus sp. 1011MAR3C5]